MGSEFVALSLPPMVIMGLIVFFHLVGGCFMDAFALIVLTVPILLPSSVSTRIPRRSLQ